MGSNLLCSLDKHSTLQCELLTAPLSNVQKKKRVEKEVRQIQLEFKILISHMLLELKNWGGYVFISISMPKGANAAKLCTYIMQ
jgi:hypothetical protein